MGTETLTLRDPSGHGFAVEYLAEDGEGNLTVRADGRRLIVPATAIERRDGSRVHLTLPLSEVTRSPDASGERTTVPVVEERLEVDRRERPGATVRVRTRTDEIEEEVAETLTRESVDVERVPVGRWAESAEGAREEGDTTIVPLYEEVLVVEKRLWLREELRLTKRSEEREETRTVRLRKQSADVERDEPDEG